MPGEQPDPVVLQRIRPPPMGVRENNAAGAATARATPSSSTSCARTPSSVALHGFLENKLSTGYTDAAVRRHRITNARNRFHQIDSAAASFTGTARYPPCTPGSREFTDSNLPRPTASWLGGPLAKPWDAGTRFRHVHSNRRCPNRSRWDAGMDGPDRFEREQ